MFSNWQNDHWSEARTISQGRDWFVNWADFPAVASRSEGKLLASWLVKSASATYAYDIKLALSSNNAVYVVPVEGGEARLLSGLDDYLEGLTWHPDGKSLTYHLSKGASQTYRAFLDGRPPELFLDKPDSWDYVGVWSPDGRRG